MIRTLYPMALALAGRFAKPALSPRMTTALLGLALLGFAPRGWTQGGTVVAWGDNRAGQATVPIGLTDVVAIASGEWHNLALKADGTVRAWGYNAGVPADLTGVVVIGAGGYHNMAVKADGTVRAWGANDYGQATVPAGLSNVVDVKGGWVHSIALKADGTVVAWGRGSEGQTNVPAGLNNVVAIASGEYHNLALKSDGTVVGWGWNGYGAASPPPGLNNVIAISGGGLHSLALKSDGTVVAWGWNQFGQTTVPPGLSNVVAIAGGIEHSLALKSDGTVVGWGANDGWASNDTNCQNIGAPCERKYTGQLDPPAGMNNVVAIAAGVFHSIALTRGSGPQGLPAPVLSVGTVGDTSVILNWNDLPNETGYRVEARVGASGNWTEISIRRANSTSYEHTGITPGTTMFYRLQAFNNEGTSPYSAQVTATPGRAIPAAPALRLGAAAHNQVTLQWDDLPDETGYTLERKAGAGDWAVIASPGAGATSFTDSGVNASTAYLYRLRAFNEAGTSGYSAEINVATPAAPAQPPVAPSLQATASSPTQVWLQWSDVTNEVSYTIERRLDTATVWSAVTTLGANATSFTEAGLVPETTYVFRIRATNSGGESAWSETSVTTPAVSVTGKPLTLHVLGSEPNGMRVRVSGDSGQRFKVQRTTDFQTWTDVADSTLVTDSTEMTLSGEAARGFFRTVNSQ